MEDKEEDELTTYWLNAICLDEFSSFQGNRYSESKRSNSPSFVSSIIINNTNHNIVSVKSNFLPHFKYL